MLRALAALTQCPCACSEISACCTHFKLRDETWNALLLTFVAHRCQSSRCCASDCLRKCLASARHRADRTVRKAVRFTMRCWPGDHPCRLSATFILGVACSIRNLKMRPAGVTGGSVTAVMNIWGFQNVGNLLGTWVTSLVCRILLHGLRATRGNDRTAGAVGERSDIDSWQACIAEWHVYTDCVDIWCADGLWAARRTLADCLRTEINLNWI
jgi:hypothetical protein